MSKPKGTSCLSQQVCESAGSEAAQPASDSGGAPLAQTGSPRSVTRGETGNRQSAQVDWLSFTVVQVHNGAPVEWVALLRASLGV